MLMELMLPSVPALHSASRLAAVGSEAKVPSFTSNEEEGREKQMRL